MAKNKNANTAEPTPPTSVEAPAAAPLEMLGDDEAVAAGVGGVGGVPPEGGVDGLDPSAPLTEATGGAAAAAPAASTGTTISGPAVEAGLAGAGGEAMLGGKGGGLLNPPEPEGPKIEDLVARREEVKALIQRYSKAEAESKASYANVTRLRQAKAEAMRQATENVLAAEAEHRKRHEAPDGWSYQMVELENLGRELAELEKVLGPGA